MEFKLTRAVRVGPVVSVVLSLRAKGIKWLSGIWQRLRQHKIEGLPEKSVLLVNPFLFQDLKFGCLLERIPDLKAIGINPGDPANGIRKRKVRTQSDLNSIPSGLSDGV